MIKNDRRYSPRNSDNNMNIYKKRKYEIFVKRVQKNDEIYEAIKLTPLEFAQNLQSSSKNNLKFTKFGKFLFILPEKFPFTLISIKIIEGEDALKENEIIEFGHEIFILIEDTLKISEKKIKAKILEHLKAKSSKKCSPIFCKKHRNRFKNYPCKMLFDFDRCFTGKLFDILKYVNNNNNNEFALNKTPINSISHSQTNSLLISNEDAADKVIKLIILSLNIYETIKFQFLGGNDLTKNQCKKELKHFEEKFTKLTIIIADSRNKIMDVISKQQNASKISRLLQKLYRYCFYCFTILQQNPAIIERSIHTNELIMWLMDLNMAVPRIAWFENAWFYLYDQNFTALLPIIYKALDDAKPESYTILVNRQTFSSVKCLYNEKQNGIIWIMDNAKDLVAADQEPKILANGKKYLFGILISNNLPSTKVIDFPKSPQPISLTYEALSTDEKPRFWICYDCKTLLQTIKREPLTIRCHCGWNLFQNLKKVYSNDFNKNLLDKAAPISAPTNLVQTSVDIIMKLDDPIGEISVDVLTKVKVTEAVSKVIEMQQPSTKLNLLEEEKEEINAVPNYLQNPLSTTSNINIIFLGETGTGKSILINAIPNYLIYPKFDNAKSAKVECIIPTKFCLQTNSETFEDVWVESGPEDTNENFNQNGESFTQKPKIHQLESEDKKITIIDTPGLSDTRGFHHDEANLEFIKQTIADVGDIGAICFVINSNQRKLTIEFEMSMRRLLSLFPSKNLSNVYFFFTFANSTYFNIGDSMGPIRAFVEKFKETNEIEIPLTSENLYCIDNESFRYLLAKQQGINLENESLDKYRYIWEKSSAEIKRFISQF